MILTECPDAQHGGPRHPPAGNWLLFRLPLSLLASWFPTIGGFAFRTRRGSRAIRNGTSEFAGATGDIMEDDTFHAATPHEIHAGRSSLPGSE